MQSGIDWPFHGICLLYWGSAEPGRAEKQSRRTERSQLRLHIVGVMVKWLTRESRVGVNRAIIRPLRWYGEFIHLWLKPHNPAVNFFYSFITFWIVFHIEQNKLTNQMQYQNGFSLFTLIYRNPSGSLKFWYALSIVYELSRILFLIWMNSACFPVSFNVFLMYSINCVMVSLDSRAILQ